MKLFIWKRVDELTDEYHSEGGLVIVAKSLEAARTVNPKIDTVEPDHTFDLAAGYNVEAGLEIIFPDSGCC